MKKLILIACFLFLILLTSCSVPDNSFKIYKQIPSDVDCRRDVVYGKGGGHDLKMNILCPKDMPEEPMPAIVWIHGGSWKEGSKDDFLGELSGFAENGYLIASIEYRLSGESPFPAQIEDCKCAVRFLRANAEKYHIDPGRIGAWGFSAGGHLAALLGASNNAGELEGNGGYAGYSSSVRAVCDWSGLADMRMTFDSNDGVLSKLFGGPPQQNIKEAAAASPAVYIGKDSADTLIMVGSKDETFALLKRTGTEFCRRLKEEDIYSEYCTVAGAGHGFDDIREFRKVKDFFDKRLKLTKG